MCGIIAFSGNPDNKFNIDKIKLLLMLNQDRGKDSYGYYTPETGIIKDTGKVELCLIKKDFTVPESSTFIGHVRSSTVGASVKDNAHPFNYGNIVLAMNGTLTNHWDLLRDYKFKYMDFDVDSQVLAAMINKDQNKSALSKILGSCAVVYTDTTTGNLYCYRNNDRPLFRGNIDGSMYISSIENSLKIIGCVDVKEFKEDNLYEIKDGAITTTYKVKRAVIETKPSNQTVLFKDENTHKSFRYIDFDTTKSEILVGEYLSPKRDLNLANGGMFFENYAYEVTGYSNKNTYEICLKDNLGNVKEVSKHLFKNQIPKIEIGCYAFSLERVKFKGIDNKKVFCEVGALLKIISIENDSYQCQNHENNLTANINKEYCRCALLNEVIEYKSIFNSNTKFPEHPKEKGFSYEDYDNNPEFVGYIAAEEASKAAALERQKQLAGLYYAAEMTKTERFQYELDNTTTETQEDLADFTIDSIGEQINDLSECNNNKAGSDIINLINILITNYREKSVMLVNQT